MALTNQQRLTQHRLFQQIRLDAMVVVTRRLEFANRHEYIPEDLIKNINTILSQYRKDVLAISDYGDFDYGPASHQYSGMLNAIIYHIEDVLVIPTKRWYHSFNKKQSIDAYILEINDLKEALLKMEKYHHTLVPNRTTPKYND